MPCNAIFSTFDFVAASLHLCGVMRFTVLFFLFFVVFGCDHAEKTKADLLYFDLPGFFAGELGRIQSQATRADVLWEKDGKQERKQAVLVDWSETFATLKKLDMNKTAFRGSYSCDTLWKAGRQQIHYNTVGGTINPKTVVLDLEAGKVTRIEVYTADKNFLYSSEVRYTYVPDDTLRISGTQWVIFGKTHSYARSYWY